MTKIIAAKREQVGRKLGTITLEVFEASGDCDFVARPVVEYNEALAQMSALLSPLEKKAVKALIDEMVASSCSLMAFVQNPDMFTKDYLK